MSLHYLLLLKAPHWQRGEVPCLVRASPLSDWAEARREIVVLEVNMGHILVEPCFQVVVAELTLFDSPRLGATCLPSNEKIGVLLDQS